MHFPGAGSVISTLISERSRRPQARNMHHGQHPYHVFGKLIDQAVVLVRKKLARPCDEARFPELRMGVLPAARIRTNLASLNGVVEWAPAAP